MSQEPGGHSKIEYMLQIQDFVAKSTGLRSSHKSEEKIQILQCADNKMIAFTTDDLDEVISRVDADGHTFLQVNFNSGKKILLTQNLIGFKPMASRGLDLSKLPKVVTTPDILSVVEAIEDSMDAQPMGVNDELDVLKKVFDAVLRGAEAVGFDTTPERLWMQSLSRQPKVSA